MMDFSLTKEELEEKLRALDATRDNFEPSGTSAMPIKYSGLWTGMPSSQLNCTSCLTAEPFPKSALPL